MEDYAGIIKELESVHSKYRNLFLASEELVCIGNLCEIAADIIKKQATAVEGANIKCQPKSILNICKPKASNVR